MSIEDGDGGAPERQPAVAADELALAARRRAYAERQLARPAAKPKKKKKTFRWQQIQKRIAVDIDPSTKAALAAFDKFDTDDSQYLHEPELKLALNELGREADQETIDAVFASCDSSEDRRIDKDEFIEWYDLTEIMPPAW